MTHPQSHSALKKNILLTPLYVWENKLIVENLKQVYTKILSDTTECSIVVYINWSEELFDESSIDSMKKNFWGMNIVCLSHLYTSKPSIWTVLADSMQLLIDRTDANDIGSYKILRMDADTYWIDDDYVWTMFDNISSEYSFVTGTIKFLTPSYWLNALPSYYTQALIIDNYCKLIQPCACGASTWYMLKDYITCWWYDRNLTVYEDTDLWKKLTNSTQKEWVQLCTWIYSNPRRLLEYQCNMRWFNLLDQRDFWFNPIQSSCTSILTNAKNSYKYLHTLLQKVIQWYEITTFETLILSKFTNNLLLQNFSKYFEIYTKHYIATLCTDSLIKSWFKNLTIKTDWKKFTIEYKPRHCYLQSTYQVMSFATW